MSIKRKFFFGNILLKAVDLFIPQGRITKVFNALPTEAARLIDERDEIKKNNPADNRIPDLTKDINKKTKIHRKSKWEEHLKTCHQGSKKLYNTIKGLGDQPQQPNNQGISFHGKTESNNRKMKHIWDNVWIV